MTFHRRQFTAGLVTGLLAAFVLAAVLTPPDVVSQLMLAIPLLLLYEVTIIAIWFTDRNKSDVEDAEEAAA